MPADGYDFSRDRLDDLQVVLRHTEPSSILVRIKVRRTREGEFVFEPAVPISIGPCTFLGLPCRGLHDLSFLPSSTLGTAHSDRELPIEWARHTLDPFQINPGQLTVRTVDLDTSKRPLDQLVAAMNDGRGADTAMRLASGHLNRLAELAPTVSERLNKATRDFDKLRQDQDALASAVEQALRNSDGSPAVPPPVAKRLASLAEQQRKLAPAVAALDLPGFGARQARLR